MNEDKPSRGIRAGDIRTTKSAPAGLLVTETETDEEGESVVDWSKGQQLSEVSWERVIVQDLGMVDRCQQHHTNTYRSNSAVGNKKNKLNRVCTTNP